MVISEYIYGWMHKNDLKGIGIHTSVTLITLSTLCAANFLNQYLKVFTRNVLVWERKYVLSNIDVSLTKLTLAVEVFVSPFLR